MVTDFDIYLAFVSWGVSGKRRPVLVFAKHDDGTSYVYPITTKYANKSVFIRQFYYRINDWISAGLDKPSFIDTIRWLDYPEDALKESVRIGRLTCDDRSAFIDFVEETPTTE